MRTPPKWAQELTLQTLLYLKGNGYDVEVPLLDWQHKQRRTSSGVCRPKSITIIAGRDRTDAKLVILHELAHWALPLTGREIIKGVESWACPLKVGHEGHTDRFWDLAWELYRWAKLPIRYCLSREREYRKGAVLAYRRSK